MAVGCCKVDMGFEGGGIVCDYVVERESMSCKFRHNFVAYLKAFLTNRRTYDRLYAFSLCADAHHCLHRIGGDAGNRTAPSGVDGSNHTFLWVAEENWHTIGGKHSHYYPFQFSDKRINPDKRLDRQSVNHCHLGAVGLPCGDDTVSGNAKTLAQRIAALGYVRRIVAGVVATVELRIGRSDVGSTALRCESVDAADIMVEMQ